MKINFNCAFTLAVILLCLNLVHGQNLKADLVPPGTIHLKNNIYIDKTPVTNRMFVEYLSFQKLAVDLGFTTFQEYLNFGKNGEFPPKPIINYPNYALEDRSKEVFLKRKGYFRERVYAYSAVLGVSIEDAADFCSWRTAMVRYFFENQNIEFLKLQYRLPTLEELNYAKRKYQSILKTKPSRKKLSNYDTPQNPESYIILPIYEFTSRAGNFQFHLQSAYTGFRCICNLDIN